VTVRGTELTAAERANVLGAGRVLALTLNQVTQRAVRHDAPEAEIARLQRDWLAVADAVDRNELDEIRRLLDKHDPNPKEND
jgi:hypothetical protein